MNGKPSFLTSTTSLGFIIVVVGAVGFSIWTKNNDLMVKLVDMLVPAYLLNKGVGLMQPKTEKTDLPFLTPGIGLIKTEPTSTTLRSTP